MAKIKRIVTSEVEGRNLSDQYGDNSLAMDSNGVVNYYGRNEMGALIAPGVLYGANHDSGDGNGLNTIKLVPHPDGSYINGDQHVVVDPTTPNHIHLRAGGTPDASNADIFLGGEKNNVMVSDSTRNVKIHSRPQQQVMAHLNLNNEGNDYLLTSDVVSAVPGWTVEVNSIMYTVADVTYPTEGQTLIYAPSAPFAFQGVYNFFSPDNSHEWTFASDGTLTGPEQNGTVKVNGLWGQDVSPLYLLGPEAVVIDGQNGEFLNDPTHPGNQIATQDYVNDAIPGQTLETTDSPTFDKVITTHNGDGTNVKIGDDAWIGDVNVANQIAIIGAQDSLEGGIILGERLGEKIYTNGEDLTIEAAGAVTIEAVGGDMNFYMDGGMYIGTADSNNQIIKRSDLNTVDAKTLPVGGTTGQVLSKVDGTDFNATWVDAAAGSSSTSVIKHAVKLAESVTKGQAVYVSSANGTNMIVSKASNATEGRSSKTLGLIETTGVLNDIVNVVAEGLLEGLDTSTATAGDPVWLGVDGNLIYGLANKPVAPDHLVFIGVVTRVNQNNGEIFVKVQNGFELDELHTVSLEATASITNNEVLAFDSATSLWKNQTAAEAGLATAVHFHNVSETYGLQTELNIRGPLRDGIFPATSAIRPSDLTNFGHRTSGDYYLRGSSSDVTQQVYCLYENGEFWARVANIPNGTVVNQNLYTTTIGTDFTQSNTGYFNLRSNLFGNNTGEDLEVMVRLVGGSFTGAVATTPGLRTTFTIKGMPLSTTWNATLTSAVAHAPQGTAAYKRANSSVGVAVDQVTYNSPGGNWVVNGAAVSGVMNWDICGWILHSSSNTSKVVDQFYGSVGLGTAAVLLNANNTWSRAEIYIKI